MIKQVTEDKAVQTNLCVDVDGVLVYYFDTGDLSYKFVTYNVDVADANAAISSVIDAMVVQSFDHWSGWRIVERIVDCSLAERYGQYSETVKFRVRDSY